MTQDIRGIGILGGTFDPVHAGHVAIARAAADSLGLVSVRFMPAGSPWQKDEVTPAVRRLAMLELAVKCDPRFGIDRTELLREGPTYTIETLAQLREGMGGSIPLVLIMGGDQWANLHTWVRWRELVEYADLAVASRSGAPIRSTPDVERWAERRIAPAESLTEEPSGRIAFFSMPAHRASSSLIRRTLALEPLPRAMQLLEGWMTADVAEYIVSEEIYGVRRARSTL